MRSSDGHSFYRRVLQTLDSRQIRFLVGGAQMLEIYAGVTRKVKDLDVYVRPRDVHATLAVLSAAGYRTEITFSHWLAKVREKNLCVDVIFGLGNGVCQVDETWFEHALDGEVYGMPIRFCAAEEMIWSKAFIMERERYDGADIAHLLLSFADRMDWQRLLSHFAPYWRVLLNHLILFGFIYPSERMAIPEWVMNNLLDRLRSETKLAAPDLKLCQGTLLSRIQYLNDVENRGYRDARIPPFGPMQPEEAERWTGAAPEASNSLTTNATFQSSEKGENL